MLYRGIVYYFFSGLSISAGIQRHIDYGSLLTEVEFQLIIIINKERLQIKYGTMRTPDELKAIYRERGMRITPQRRMIFELLAGDSTHPTAEDIYRRLQSHLPEVSRATVYNTLHELVEIGELQVVNDLSDKGTRYDVMTSHHHHLYCRRCERLWDVDLDLGEINLPAGSGSGFEIDHSQVTFYGICQACQQADSE